MPRKKTVKDKKLHFSFRIKIIFLSLIFILTGGTFFFLGLFWHTLYYGNFRHIPNNFFWFSYNNLTESYQTNCITPPLSQRPFHFTNHLSCQNITNQYLDSKPNASDLEVTFQKDDWVTFSLDYQEKILKRSRDIGSSQTMEPYTIVQDSHNIIQAVRPIKNMDTTGSKSLPELGSYDFITLSKVTGKGMEVRHNLGKWMNLPNSDSITSNFFQCK